MSFDIRKDIKAPWDTCPTVWRRFCEFNKRADTYRFQETYKFTAEVRQRFKWFYYGFEAGGNS